MMDIFYSMDWIDRITGWLHGLWWILHGRGVKQIEWIPPDGCSPAMVGAHLGERGIGWTNRGFIKAPSGRVDEKGKQIMEEHVMCCVPQKQAKWVEAAMLRYGCEVFSPLEDPKEPPRSNLTGPTRSWKSQPRAGVARPKVALKQRSRTRKPSRQTIGGMRRLWWRITDAF